MVAHPSSMAPRAPAQEAVLTPLKHLAAATASHPAAPDLAIALRPAHTQQTTRTTSCATTVHQELSHGQYMRDQPTSSS